MYASSLFTRQSNNVEALQQKNEIGHMAPLIQPVTSHTPNTWDAAPNKCQHTV